MGRLWAACKIAHMESQGFSWLGIRLLNVLLRIAIQVQLNLHLKMTREKPVLHIELSLSLILLDHHAELHQD